MKISLLVFLLSLTNFLYSQNSVVEENDPLLKTADSLMNEKAYGLAKEKYTEVLKYNQASTIFFKRALVENCLKDYQSAIDDYTILINRGDYSLGDCYFMRGMCKISIHQDSCPDFFKAKELGFKADWDMLFSLCSMK